VARKTRWPRSSTVGGPTVSFTTKRRAIRSEDQRYQREAHWTVGALCDADRVIVVFDAELWIWDARRDESWTFVSLPAEASEEIRDLADGPRRGFGSLRVRVTLGASRWTTSIFPDRGRGSYVLPIKRAVRNAEALDVGDIATVTVELVDLPAR
jgi:hypothetical protein